MKTKVIHILGHSPGPGAYNADLPNLGSTNPSDSKYFVKIPRKPYIAGFFQNDWHVQVASQIERRNQDYEHECWRPYRGLDKTYSKNIKGIIHKIFPSFYFEINSRSTSRSNSSEYSGSLIRELEKEIKKKKIIIHLHGMGGILFNRISSKFGSTPILCSQYGQRSHKYAYSKSSSLLSKFANYVLFNLERYFFKGIDVFLVVAKTLGKFLSNKNNHVIFFHGTGINFEDYKLDKVSSRKDLGIPFNKKMILYVGKLYYLKGVDKIIEYYPSMKNSFDCTVYLVGCNKSDQYYYKCLDLGMNIIPRIPNSELKKYYSAADIYISHFTKDKGILDSAGMGISSIEALASGTPIIGNNLINYEGNIDDVGILLSEGDSWTEKMRIIFNNYRKYDGMANKAKQYYSWDSRVSGFLKCYHFLERNYNFN